MATSTALTRRAFLKAGVAAGGGLLISFTLDLHATSQPLPGTAELSPFADWVHIRADNRVVVKLPGTDMGQGHATAMPMLVADEMEADWKLVGFELAEGSPKYINPLYHMQSTTGSMSVRGYSVLLRKIGAAARMMLIAAAALRWNVEAGECRAESSQVMHPPSGRSASFGQLADAAASLPFPTEIPLKKPSEWKLLGRPTLRLDGRAQVTGKAVYGQDVRLPGMFMGAIALSPVLGGKLKAYNEARARAVKGVQAVVPLRGEIPNRDDAVVVVADSTWHAFQGLKALEPVWEPGSNASLNQADLWRDYRAALDESGVVVEDHGEAPKAIEESAQRVDAHFEVPFLAHAPLEPMNATAVYGPSGIEIWCPTQACGVVQADVAKAFGLPLERVKVHVTFVGGGFGRRGDVDYAFPAVLASRAAGAPVQVVWSREEDMRHDSYRPATAIRMRAGLDADGRVKGISIKHTNSSIAARLLPRMLMGGKDPISSFGFTNSPYEYPARRVEYVMKNLPVPVGFWRSVSATYTGFAMECFLDALSRSANRDPFQFRLALLKDHPRHAAVLKRLAEESSWETPPPAGHFRGMAFHESDDTMVGLVVEISLHGKEYRIHRIVAVVDCGWVVNPLTATAQVSGGILFGLAAAQYGEITIRNGSVQQGNYRDYRLLRMAQAPPVEVHFAHSEETQGGLGEPGVPTIAPALANALFAAQGERIYRLPLSALGYSLI